MVVVQLIADGVAARLRAVADVGLRRLRRGGVAEGGQRPEICIGIISREHPRHLVSLRAANQVTACKLKLANHAHHHHQHLDHHIWIYPQSINLKLSLLDVVGAAAVL